MNEITNCIDSALPAAREYKRRWQEMLGEDAGDYTELAIRIHRACSWLHRAQVVAEESGTDALADQLIFLWISLLEAMTIPAYAGFALGYDRRPGDFSFDPLGFYPTDPEKQREMQLKELKNGRLAMIAIGGMVTGATITGHGFPYV